MKGEREPKLAWKVPAARSEPALVELARALELGSPDPRPEGAVAVDEALPPEV